MQIWGTAASHRCGPKGECASGIERQHLLRGQRSHKRIKATLAAASCASTKSSLTKEAAAPISSDAVILGQQCGEEAAAVIVSAGRGRYG